jgi:hypothetical protein
VRGSVGEGPVGEGIVGEGIVGEGIVGEGIVGEGIVGEGIGRAEDHPAGTAPTNRVVKVLDRSIESFFAITVSLPTFCAGCEDIQRRERTKPVAAFARSHRSS